MIHFVDLFDFISLHCLFSRYMVCDFLPLFSESVFDALGTNYFAPYGSLNNHHLIAGSSTESQSEGFLCLFL